MMKLPLKKLYFLVKLCFMFVIVIITLSLFEYWRGGRRATRALILEPDEETLERQILEDEARIIPGLGEGGGPAYLTGEDKRLGEETEKKYAVNTYLSDRIAYNRTLKDFRNPACDRVTYDAELPSTSVIIIFHNEPYSVVIRTIWSVLNTARRDQPWHRRANYLERGTGRVMKLGYPDQPEDSEYVYLKEIILVDDNSTLPELRGKLARYIKTRLPADMVRVLRLPDRIGLTRARLAGARYAVGDVLIFLDAHCEGVTDWMRPMLQRIKDFPSAVVMPIIDVIGHKDFLYSVQDPAMFQVGGFTFVGHFTWIDVPEREKKRRGSDIAPTWSPTMAGGLFAIRRAYYWELGAYDEQMAGWGGENLEMSFRIWQCGGTLETVPCSRVGHVFRSFHPYGLPANSDTHGINTARMAEVWMDEYAELFYLHRPDLRKNPKIGDVTHRKILREKLHCKSFQWFLDNIYQEKYVPVRDSQAFGRVRNDVSHMCLDTMQREGDAVPLGFYPCHRQLTDTQFLSLSLSGQLRGEENCAEVQFVRDAHLSAEEENVARTVVVVTCRDRHNSVAQWRHIPGTGQLQHIDSGLCLDTRDAHPGDDAKVRPCHARSSAAPTQRWAFDYDGDNVTPGVLPAELEQKLIRIKGQRRKSRSLLSADEPPVEGAGAAAEAEAEAGAGAQAEAGASAGEGAVETRRSHRSQRRRSKRKKIHKNKFIVTVERTRPNGSVEHLEMDIYCRHRKLYPNNSFVRDLVSILNDRDIRVINNGRVFEKNKVIVLKDHLRKKTESVKTTPEPDNEVPEPKTEKPWSAPPSPPSVPHEDHDDVPPTTEFFKIKKRLKKKYGKKSHKKERSHEHSLLLPEGRDFVSIGGGKRANSTRVTLRAESESDRELGARPPGRLTWSAEDRDSYSFTARPDSSELRLNEDRARDDYGRGDTWGDNEGHRTPGLGKDTFEERHRDMDKETRAREDAIARHAEVLSEVQGKPGDRASRPRHPKDPDHHKPDRVRHKSDHDRHTADHDRHPVDRDRNSVEHDRYATESERDGTELNPWDPWETDHTHIAGSVKDSDARKALPHDPHDEVAKFVFNDVWERPTQADSRVSELAKQVMMEYDEFTQQPAMTPHQRSGMQEGLALREKLVRPSGGEAPGKRGEAGERGEAHGKRGEAGEGGEANGKRGEAGEGGEANGKRGEAGEGGEPHERGKALRLRVKSNMTFNLGDELLNWRRSRTKGSSQESDSESTSNDEHI